MDGAKRDEWLGKKREGGSGAACQQYRATHVSGMASRMQEAGSEQDHGASEKYRF